MVDDERKVVAVLTKLDFIEVLSRRAKLGTAAKS